MTGENLVDELTDDSFTTFENSEWILADDATYTGSSVRLTPSSSGTSGRLELRRELDENIWDAIFSFDIQNASSPGGEAVYMGFYADNVSIAKPDNGYRVVFNHDSDSISLRELEDGEEEVLSSTNITISESEHEVDAQYNRGHLVVRLDNTTVIDYEIDDPLNDSSGFFLAAVNTSNYARHIVDDVRITQRGRRNAKTAQNAWNNGGIDVSEGTNTYGLLRALTSGLDQADFDLNEVYRSHHINTARGDELDKIGELVQLKRKSGESDDKYRARLKIQFRVGNIGTTFDEFSQLVSSILDTEIENIEFITDLQANPATAQLSANPTVYDNAALSRQEVADFLGEAVPAGHEVSVLETGTFRLKADGETDDPDKGLTSDSISTGGTLASDIV